MVFYGSGKIGSVYPDSDDKRQQLYEHTSSLHILKIIGHQELAVLVVTENAYIVTKFLLKVVL